MFRKINFSKRLILQISPADKVLRKGHDAIRLLAGRLNLTKKVIDRATITFKSCYENKFLRGRSQDIVAAVCIYSASREEGSSRTIKGN